MSGKPFYTYLLCILILSLGTSYGDTNVLTNPGFESGTTGWAGRSCNITTVTSPVHSGSLSGRAYDRYATWQGIKQDMMGKMVQGETYNISAWVRISGATSATVKVTFEQEDGSGTNYLFVDSVTANNSSWVRLSGSFTLNVTGTLSVLDVYFEGPPRGVDIYVDDAAVYGPEPSPPGPNATGQVDVTTRHQEIEGFGASGAWYENWLTEHPQKNQLYDILFGQLGLDIYRLRNTYDQDGSDDYMSRSAEIITEGKSSLGRPLKIMISCWSPPTYLKSNDNLAHGTLKKDPNGDYMYTEFAEWWGDSLDEWSSHGIDADYVNMQNEPDWEADWDTCRFEPSENYSYAGYNLAFEAVYAELHSQMGSAMPKMLAAEAAGIPNSGDYLDNLIDDSHVYGYSHHLYNIGSSQNPDAYITAMTNFKTQYGDRPLMQTEYEDSTGAWPDAMNLAILMHNSLTVEEVSAYLYWDLFWGESGGLVTLPSYGSPSYTINSDYYGFKHYSAFVDSGWQRVDASSDSSSLRISAYISSNNQQLSVVIINISTDTDIELDLSFTGFSVADGDVYRSSQTENCILVGSFDGIGPLTVPANSIITLALSGTLILTNCQQVQGLGLNLPADLNGNCYVDYTDLLVLVDQWLSTNPVAIPPYYSPDIYSNGEVNLLDFAVFATDWVNCNNPQDEICLQNW